MPRRDAESFSYEELSKQELDLLCLMAQQADPLLPVYSGDVAVAFGIRHRFLKDCIEGQYRQLRVAYGKKVHRVAHKRSGDARAMNGYLLPLQAMMQVFYQAGLMRSTPTHNLPEFLHLCFSSDPFVVHLN